ncbi:Uncharacterised protein [uncultured archaeon]|nr:Uncharacterised protein [uncultured archaeon]
MDSLSETLGRPSEKLRQQLIEQELRLRKKQPEHWAKTKYRKYAKPFTEEELVQIKELDKKRKVERRANAKKSKKASRKRKAGKTVFKRKRKSKKQ